MFFQHWNVRVFEEIKLSFQDIDLSCSCVHFLTRVSLAWESTIPIDEASQKRCL